MLAVGASMLLVLGCNRPSPSARDDLPPQDAEPKIAQITVWGDRHEIFIEHRLVVANTPAKFVTHITDLQTLEPRREGAVKFVLRQDHDTPIEQVEKEPTRAGIYEAILTFPRAGSWSVSVGIPTEGGEVTVDLPPINVFVTQHDASLSEEQEAPAGISFLKEQQWTVRSKAESVTKRRLIERVRVPATVAARPGSLARVATPIAGRVIAPLGKGLPAVGDRVEQGQILALVQPSFSELATLLVEAEAEVTRAKLALEQAELTFQRTEKLVAVEAKSVRDVEEAKFALKSAQARLAAAQSLQSTYHQSGVNDPGAGSTQPAIELKSPIAGVITEERRAPVGEYIAAETLLYTVLDNESVYIEGKVPETAMARLTPAKNASYTFPGEPGMFTSLTGESGHLVFTGLQVDAATRTVPILYEVKNVENRLRIGQFLTLHVETQRVEEALAVPDSALVEEGGQPVAFVQVSGETFQKRELQLGIRDGHWVQVMSGLGDGERVVTKGAMAIRLASASAVIPAHGHAH